LEKCRFWSWPDQDKRFWFVAIELKDGHFGVSPTKMCNSGTKLLN
jgi:hypothetical protein